MKYSDKQLQVLQQALIALTEAGIIRFEEKQEQRFSDIGDDLQELPHEPHPVYCADVCFTVGYQENIEFEDMGEGELKEPRAKPPTLALSIEIINDPDNPEPDFRAPASEKLLAAAKRSHEGQEHLLKEIGKILNRKTH